MRLSVGLQTKARAQSPARAPPPTLDSTDWSDHTGIDELPPIWSSHASAPHKRLSSGSQQSPSHRPILRSIA